MLDILVQGRTNLLVACEIGYRSLVDLCELLEFESLDSPLPGL
jgi:hypothetical protein